MYELAKQTETAFHSAVWNCRFGYATPADVLKAARSAACAALLVVRKLRLSESWFANDLAWCYHNDYQAAKEAANLYATRQTLTL